VIPLLSSALLAAAAAPAASPSPTPTPPAVVRPESPPAELAELAPFEGRWECERVDADKGLRASRSTLAITRDLGGFWYAGRAAVDGKDVRRFFWTWDAVLGKFVGGWLDDAGAWSAQTALGWEEDKLVFLGHVTMTGEKVSARETFTRPQDGTFLRTVEVLGFIEWRRVLEERCRRP
jgi:hypothetical protein